MIETRAAQSLHIGRGRFQRQLDGFMIETPAAAADGAEGTDFQRQLDGFMIETADPEAGKHLGVDLPTPARWLHDRDRTNHTRPMAAAATLQRQLDGFMIETVVSLRFSASAAWDFQRQLDGFMIETGALARLRRSPAGLPTPARWLHDRDVRPVAEGTVDRVGFQRQLDGFMIETVWQRREVRRDRPSNASSMAS